MKPFAERWRRVLRRMAKLALILMLGGILLRGAEFVLEQCSPFDLTHFDAIESSTRVLARDGRELRATAPNGERRIDVPLAGYSTELIHALLAAEDNRFFEHSGVDPYAVVRAIGADLAAGRIVSGASTLSMQVVRIAEPRPRTLRSKIVEALHARQLERKLDKHEILEHYLDLAPLGSGVRGFEAAARLWFGKSAQEIDAVEGATLVALLPAPSRRAKPKYRGELLAARDRVLDRMLDAGHLDEVSHAKAIATPLTMTRHAWPFEAPALVEERLARETRSKGIIQTEIDLDLQREVERIVVANVTPGVDGVAVVVVERASGAVRALIGSRDWTTSQWNAASHPREVGSTLKPFLFAAAISAGVASRDSLLDDTATAFGDYRPKNFDDDYRGRTRVSDALRQSRNVPAVSLLDRIGPSRFVRLLRSLGLEVPWSRGTLDLALGTLSASPLSLAEAWRRFGDLEIEIPELSTGARDEVLSMLRDHRPPPGLRDDGTIAWKTGTSNGRRDAWCVGLTARHSIAVWLGNLDGRRQVSLVGVRLAAPLFARIAAAVD